MWALTRSEALRRFPRATDISCTKEGQFVTGTKEGVGQGVCACTGMRVGETKGERRPKRRQHDKDTPKTLMSV